MKTRVKYSSAVLSIINRAGSRAISFDDLDATSIDAGATDAPIVRVSRTDFLHRFFPFPGKGGIIAGWLENTRSS
jgi:hypothetical protein